MKIKSFHFNVFFFFFLSDKVRFLCVKITCYTLIKIIIGQSHLRSKQSIQDNSSSDGNLWFWVNRRQNTNSILQQLTKVLIEC